jgi:tRNA dimethylallyltransferase
LNVALDENGIESLQKELKKVDPTYYEKADIKNPHRIIRALEIYRASGKPFSSFLNQGVAKRNFKTIYIGLDAARETIYDRINKRVDQMISEGLLEEAKQLYPNKELNALQTVGYRELFAYFDGTLSLDEVVSEIKKNTRRFAKRQGTWFRKNDQIEWFNYETEPAEIVRHIKTKNAL